MLEIEICTESEVISIAAPQGLRVNQRNTFYALYVKETGEKLPDNIYRVKQGDKCELCCIVRERARPFSFAPNEPMYLL